MADSRLAASGSDSLLRRLTRGDESALAEALVRYWDAVVDYASRLLDSSDAGQDVAQEAFVRLWDRRADWAEDSEARPILFRIARNLAIDHHRAARVHARLTAAQAGISTAGATGAELVDEAELRAAIERALLQLTAREREIVVLSRFHGQSRAEIAAITGLTPGTISNLLSIAMTRLARALGPHLDHPAGADRRRLLRRA